MPTISEYVSLDFDLSDYEDDIIEDYVRQMEMNIYNYSRKEIKSYEDIYNDLKMMLKEN